MAVLGISCQIVEIQLFGAVVEHRIIIVQEVLRRAVVVLETNVEEGEEPYVIELINPEIIETEGEQEGPEGCLSVPGVYGWVKRPDYAKLRAQDRNGEWFEVEGVGLTARAFLHECEHLDGHLFLERADHIMSDEEMEEYYGGGETA